MGIEEKLHRCECGKPFLTERGKVVHSYSCEESSKEGGPTNEFERKVTSEECDGYRKRVLNGESAYKVAEDIGISENTLRYHVKGECMHKVDHPECSYNREDNEWVRC